MAVTSASELAARRFEREYGFRPDAAKAALFDFLAITEAEHIASLFPRLLDQLAVRGLNPPEARAALQVLMEPFYWNREELQERIAKAARVVVHSV